MHLCSLLEEPNILRLCLLSRLLLGNDELRRLVLLAYMILSFGLPGGQTRKAEEILVTSSTLNTLSSSTHLRKLHPPDSSECIGVSSRHPVPWRSLRTCCGGPPRWTAASSWTLSDGDLRGKIRPKSTFPGASIDCGVAWGEIHKRERRLIKAHHLRTFFGSLWCDDKEAFRRLINFPLLIQLRQRVVNHLRRGGAHVREPAMYRERMGRKSIAEGHKSGQEVGGSGKEISDVPLR